MPILEAVGDAAGLGLLWTALLLGIRHGFDWDHIAAITDITSTTAAADAGVSAHERSHSAPERHSHAHGGPEELTTHGGPEDDSGVAQPAVDRPANPARVQRHAILLGTLYALGHGLVVAALGLLALLFGALLPSWIDPIMGRVVGVTLLVLGVWVYYSLYQYARHGTEFRLRSRWMLAFDSFRYLWRRFQGRLHGHEHKASIEMSSYGPWTSFGVGMIHGVGAETGSQVLIIAAVGGAASAGLGVPMMFAFIAGLLISNTGIVLLSATGFVASQLRQRIYVVVGAVAATFSIVLGLIFLLEMDAMLPDLSRALGA